MRARGSGAWSPAARLRSAPPRRAARHPHHPYAALRALPSSGRPLQQLYTHERGALTRPCLRRPACIELMPAREPSPSPSRSASSPARKRPLPTSASTADIQSAPKRANSEDYMASSDHEGSIGASRLNIDSTPRSPASNADSPAAAEEEADVTVRDAADTGMMSPEPETEELPPAYEGGPADHREDEDLPTFASTSQYNGPAADQQLALINDMKDFRLEEGDTWFLVPRTWYRRWQTACSGVAQSKDDDDSLTPEQVGPIDTTSLAEEDGVSLRKPVQVGVDVEVLPEAAWRYLVDWCASRQVFVYSPTRAHSLPSSRYGQVGPEFDREVIATAGFGSETIEFYPPLFRLYLLLPATSSDRNVSVPSLEHAPSIQLASSSTVGDLFHGVKEAFSLERNVRLWRLPSAADEVSALEGPAYVFADKLRESGVELFELDKLGSSTTLGDALLADDETRLAVEEQDSAQSWIVDADAVLAALADADVPAPAPDSAPQSLSASVASLTDADDAHGDEKKKKHHHHGHRNLFSSASSWAAGLHKPKGSGTAAAGSSTTGAAPAKAASGGGMMGALTGALTRSKTAVGGKQGQRGLVGLQNLGK